MTVLDDHLSRLDSLALLATDCLAWSTSYVAHRFYTLSNPPGTYHVGEDSNS